MRARQRAGTPVFTRGKPEQLHLKGKWFGTSLRHTWPDSEPWLGSLSHWEYPDSSSIYKLHVTSHCRDTEQKCSMEGDRDRRKEKIKGGTRMSQRVYCGFFQDSTCPFVEGNQPCLVMRVFNQANNCQQPCTNAKMCQNIFTALLSLPIHVMTS